MWKKTASTGQVAKMLGKHRETIRRMILRGELQASRVDPLCVHSPLRIALCSVDAYKQRIVDGAECSVNEAAAQLGTTMRTIQRMIKRGSVKFRRVGRSVRVLRSSLPVNVETRAGELVGTD